MKKTFQRITLIITIIAIAISLSRPARAQTADAVYFPETGHWVWGEFLKMYNSVSDPLLFFGYPITDDFTDPAIKARVQYFQKARFDLVNTPEGTAVQLAPLGQLLHEPGAPLADIPKEGPNCRSFKSGYPVCYAFLQFFDAYDEAALFGMPISDVEVIEARFMQTFEYARMEWWPDNPSGKRVVLSDLGQLYFDKMVADPDLLAPSPSPDIAGNLINPRVQVFTVKSLIGANERQSVFVVVQDQFLRPVEGAQAGVTVLLPGGGEEYYRLPETNEFGFSQFTFTTADLPVSAVVNLRAEISIRGEHASGRSWFRIWW